MYDIKVNILIINITANYCGRLGPLLVPLPTLKATNVAS